LNILLCAGTFTALSGYNLVVRRLAVEFRTLGHRGAILCRKPPADLLPGENPEDFLVFRGWRFWPGLRARVNKALSAFGPGVVFIHNVDLADLAGAGYARRRGIPLLAMCHARFGPYVHLAMPWKAFRLRIVGFAVERWMARRLKNADMVFALTGEMEAYLRRIGLSRLTVIGCGVDREGLAPREATSGATVRADASKVVRLLFVGQIKRTKNQIFLLEMSRFLPPHFRLDLIGGKHYDRPYFRKFLRAYRSGKFPNVAWHGERSPSETAEFFHRADLFVNPSLIEVQNLAQIEALAAGLPTVRLHGPLTGGVTVHGQTAVHLEGNVSPQAFAEAIVRLAGDRALYEKIRAGALVESRRYSWRISAERILEVFAQTALLKGRAIPARERKDIVHEERKAILERE
jgi:alpha-1,6-mannosyltransferase